MDDVGKLVLFRDVVELGGFSAAAAKWNLNHSTVSKHVKTVERELRVQLLERTSRTMRLTAPGRIVYEHSGRIGVAYREMLRRLDEMRGEVSGELRIGSLLHVGHHVLQPAVARFLAAFPEVRVTLLLQDEPLAFYRNSLDLALRVGLPSEGTLIARKLLDNDVCLVATPELLERAGPLEHPEDLAQYPTVAYSSADVEITSWAYSEGGEERTVSVHPRLRTTDGNSLLTAVRNGIGVGYLSTFAVREDLEVGRLVTVLPSFELPAYAPVYLLSAQSEYASPRIEAFKQSLFETARAMQGPSLERKGDRLP